MTAMILISIFAPLLLVLLFKNKYVGFATVCGGIIALHTLIGLVTQVLHVFTKPTVVTLHVLLAVAVVVTLYLKRTEIGVLRIRHKRLAEVLFFIFALGIVAYQLYAVHFNYTGPIMTVGGEQHVSGDRYAHPLFSDEWIAVAIARDSIAENRLPFKNPFTGEAYQNYLFVFHVFAAEIGILFGSTLTTTYVWLGIVVNTAMVGMIFVVLRSLGVSRGIAVFGMLLTPYIVNSSNLPGLWYLLPWNLGFLVLLTTSVLIAHRLVWLAVGSAILAAVVYPPIIVFAIPMLLTLCVEVGALWRRRILTGVLAFMVAAPLLFITGVSVITDLSFADASARFFDTLFRPMFSAGGLVPTFFIWYVVPWVILPFMLYALFTWQKNIRHLLIPLMIGVIGWVLNPITDTTFLIDYHRLVAITALLMVIVGSVGLHHSWVLLEDRYRVLRRVEVHTIIAGVMLIVFLMLVPSYTARDTWRKFTSEITDLMGNSQIIRPASPVNRYLHPDDVRIFSAFSGERFLSPGWKGLVLGALTDNEPLYTKSSTITIKQVMYEQFAVANCEEKARIAKQYRITYIYAEKINCAGFEVVDQSAEGLYVTRVSSR